MMHTGQTCIRYQRQLPWTRLQCCCRVFFSLRYKSSLRKRDYYEILGISRLANKKAIRDAYIAKSKKLHPDRIASSSGDAGAHEKFVELQEAYEVLRNRATRIEYDTVSRRQQTSTTRKSRSDTTDSHHSNQTRWNQRENQADGKVKTEIRGGKTDEMPLEKLLLLWTRRISFTVLLTLFVLGYIKTKQREKSARARKEQERLAEEWTQQESKRSMRRANPTASCIRCQRLFASYSASGSERNVHSNFCFHHWHCRSFVRLLSFSTSQRKRDYYEVLGIGRSATQKTIRDAYISQSKKLHPDRNMHDQATSSSTAGSHQKFVELQEAYEVLRSPAKRADYDILGHPKKTPINPSRPSTDSNYRSQPYGSAYESWNSHYRSHREDEAYSSGWNHREYYKQAYENAKTEYQSAYREDMSDRRSIVGSLLLYSTVFFGVAVQIALILGLIFNIGEKKQIMAMRELLLAEWRKQQEFQNIDGMGEAASWTPLHDEILKLGRADRETRRFLDLLAR